MRDAPLAVIRISLVDSSSVPEIDRVYYLRKRFSFLKNLDMELECNSDRAKMQSRIRDRSSDTKGEPEMITEIAFFVLQLVFCYFGCRRLVQAKFHE